MKSKITGAGKLQCVILLAVTHYNNAQEVEDFLNHVLRFHLPDDWRFEIAVSDNSGTLKLSGRGYERVTVYRPGENLGYLRGCSYAVERWVENNGGFPGWVGVSNTDIEFTGDFFRNLINLDLPGRVCVIAPDIVLETGLHQNPYKKCRPNRMEMYAYTLIYRNRTLVSLMDAVKAVLAIIKWKWNLGNASSPVVKKAANPYYEIIYAPHGSCFFLCPIFFEKGGALNFRGFMYGEEIYVAEQAMRLNMQVAWVPELKLIHHRRKSTGLVTHLQKVRWRRESARILWDDFFSKK